MAAPSPFVSPHLSLRLKVRLGPLPRLDLGQSESVLPHLTPRGRAHTPPAPEKKRMDLKLKNDEAWKKVEEDVTLKFQR
jgi:hypothetical protein